MLLHIIHSTYLLVMWLTILQVHNWDKNLTLGKIAIVNWISFEKTELLKGNVSYVVLPLRCPWTIWHLHILVMQIWEKNKTKMFWSRHLICIGMPHANSTSELMKWHLAWTLRRHAKLQKIQMANVPMRVVHCPFLNATWCKIWRDWKINEFDYFTKVTSLIWASVTSSLWGHKSWTWTFQV